MIFVAAAVGTVSFPTIPTSIFKNKVTNFDANFNFLLKRCKTTKELKQLYARVLKEGYQQKNKHVFFKFIRLCSDLNSMDYATQIFQRIEEPDAFLYTSLIYGLISIGSCLDAIHLYAKMLNHSVEIDSYVISAVLKACSFSLTIREGKEVHGRALKLQLGSDRPIRMKLMEFYGKCGKFLDARKVFDEIPDRDGVASTIMLSSYVDHGLVGDALHIFNQVTEKDTVCWTAMIDGLARNERMNEALDLFRKMQALNVKPNGHTMVCVLSACSQLGALELGRWVHSYVGKSNISLNTFVGSALIDMYCKCGSLGEAQKVFDEIPERDVIVWNSLISGLAMHGKSREALSMFNQMNQLGVKPTGPTLVSVLNACSHGGLVDEGFEIFHSMSRVYGIEPRIEHYGCMVDLLGRMGHLKEAYDFVKKMIIRPDNVIWASLLGACKIHKNLTLGEEIATIILDEGNADSGTYVLLANIYASFGKWEEAVKVRAKMKEKGIEKEPGCSSIEVPNEIHEFLLGDVRHPCREGIYKKLDELDRALRLEGYSPETEDVLQNIDEDEKERALAIHSERLAISYGLISTEPGTTLRIVKNLRVCNDCHSIIKLISKVTGRKIVIRDRNRFHHFGDGSCSCGDYW